MTSSDAELTRLLGDARTWAAQDPDPATAAALTDLVRLADDGAAAARRPAVPNCSVPLKLSASSWRAAAAPPSASRTSSVRAAAVAGSGSWAAQARASLSRRVSSASEDVIRTKLAPIAADASLDKRERALQIDHNRLARQPLTAIFPDT